MSGFGDGYVGTAQDAVKIRRLEKQREAERRKIEELKNKSADGQPGLLQFGSSTSEVIAITGSRRLVFLSSHMRCYQTLSVRLVSTQFAH
jgi:protein FAM50